jgi:hypothetical protein
VILLAEKILPSFSSDLTREKEWESAGVKWSEKPESHPEQGMLTLLRLLVVGFFSYDYDL